MVDERGNEAGLAGRAGPATTAPAGQHDSAVARARLADERDRVADERDRVAEDRAAAAADREELEDL